jgi:hypothetical protein
MGLLDYLLVGFGQVHSFLLPARIYEGRWRHSDHVSCGTVLVFDLFDVDDRRSESIDIH